ncbi:MAG: hypothetical protein JNJ77_05110 [Planctomycetia bacterium]|nr:hypothetical protein [Planctomycetia bacterium]
MFGRIVLGLVSGILTVFVLTWLALHSFFSAHMDVVAVIILAIGLVVAGVVWRSSRKLAYRAVSESELQNGFDVHLSLNYLVMMFGFGIITFGTFGLFFWLASRRFPRRLDMQGITLRNGSYHSWISITLVTKLTKRINHVPVTTAWQLEFGNEKAEIVARSLREGASVMKFLSRTLGGDLT